MEFVAPAAILIGAAIVYQKSNVPPRVIERIRTPDSFHLQYQLFRQKDLYSGGPPPGTPINMQTGPQDDLDPRGALNAVYDQYSKKLEPSDYHLQVLAQSVQAGEFINFREENGRHLQILMPAYNGELYANEPYRNNGLYAQQTANAWQQ